MTAPYLNRGSLPRSALRFFPMLTDERLHPTAWTIPAILDNPTIPWVRALGELYANPISFPSSMSPEAGLLLHSLVRNIRPRTVVEIGTFVGVSTIWMAAALEDASRDPGRAPVAAGEREGIIHCFDLFRTIQKDTWRETELSGDVMAFVRGNLERAGLLHRVEFHPGFSAKELANCRDLLRGPNADPAAPPQKRPGGVDFALVDGDHTVKGVLADLAALEPVLNPGGYILLHDTFPEQCGDHFGPRHALDHLSSTLGGLYESCELYTAPLNYGMALLRRIG